MTELTVAVGLHPSEKIKQNLKQLDPAGLIGEGKRKEITEIIKKTQASYVIFDHNLSGMQTRNLEKEFQLVVLDRNQLILEIFSQRAQSFEGKLQVQLAQLMDQMPRMTGAWLGSLSRQGGGQKTKGPGEKALEQDRRHIRKKIKTIKDKLKKVSQSRSQYRAHRKKKKIPSFALVGYTNSGKSSLLNRLTKSRVETRNQAFMTLDPRTRKVFIPGVAQAVMTDTVGFIRNIPHHLIEAFKATLEESAQADVLLHIVDISDPNFKKHIEVVNRLIEEFNWNNKPRIYVFNKHDLLEEEGCSWLSPEYQPRVYISARTGYGINNLLEEMKLSLEKLSQKIELFFPKDKEYEIYNLSREIKIKKKEIMSQGCVCQVQMTESEIHRWKKYIVKA